MNTGVAQLDCFSPRACRACVMNWLGYRGSGGKRGSSIIRASAEIRVGADSDISDAPYEGHARLGSRLKQGLPRTEDVVPTKFATCPGFDLTVTNLCHKRRHSRSLPKSSIQDELPNDDDDDEPKVDCREPAQRKRPRNDASRRALSGTRRWTMVQNRSPVAPRHKNENRTAWKGIRSRRG
jgi:hypothetical protein